MAIICYDYFCLEVEDPPVSRTTRRPVQEKAQSDIHRNQPIASPGPWNFIILDSIFRVQRTGTMVPELVAVEDRLGGIDSLHHTPLAENRNDAVAPIPVAVGIVAEEMEI